MKQKCFLLAAILLSQIFNARSSEKINWTGGIHTDISFVENKGQFDGRNKLPGTTILYALDYGATQIFFTKNSVTYYFEKKEKTPNRRKGDNTVPKYYKTYEVLHTFWEDANPDVEVIARDTASDYYGYSFKNPNDNSYYYIENARGYKKLIYKNLYPNVDVVYEIHPESGIKYSLVLRPHADVSRVKIRFDNGSREITLRQSGKIHAVTMYGDLIEHEPATYYANSRKVIQSKHHLQGNVNTFVLSVYDKSKTVIIDPWVQTPTSPNSNCVWECEKDGNGNVYIIGGDSPMRLRKYNSAGVLQWTHSTPWDTTAGDWLGTLAVDLAGNSYVTNGSSAALQKVNTNGTVLYTVNGGFLDEYWTIAFNCDQTKLVVGGTRLGPFPPSDSYGMIFDIDANTGGVIASQRVASIRPGPIVSDINEVRSISSSRNAKYYFLTLDTIGAINQNITACSGNRLFAINSTYNFAYKSEFFRPNNGNSGICAIRANDQFVYTQNGTTVHKRSLTTGAILASASIPGGINTTLLAFNQPGNSGIDIDECGNVYVGSADRIIKFDANLNIITSVNLPFRVFDVAVSYNGDIIVAGSTGNSDSTPRTGYVQSINMNACAPFQLVCCDATICPVNAVCSNVAPFNLTAVTSGGTWSGPGITNTTAGTFNPAAAGVGTHTITYTLSCGSESIQITVNNCANLSVCIEPNGNYTVSGGTGPYTWESGTPFQNCSACFFGQCLPPICNGYPDTNWTVIGTTPTITPPGTFPIRVRDSGVNSLRIYSAASLPQCSTVTCPTIVVSVASQTNVSCAGGNNGSVTVTATGGQAPYTFVWAGGITGSTRSNLTAGNYTVTATDANNCTGTLTVTITAPSALSLNTSSTGASCGSNNGSASVSVTGGTPGYTYSWNNGATTSSISGIAAGSYTVTVRDNNNCTATATVMVSSTGGAIITLNNQTNVRCNGANDGSIDVTVTGGTPPYTFLWNTGATTEDISGLAPGSYTLTVNDNNNCPSFFTATITEPGILAISGTTVNAGCGVSDGRVDITVNGGTQPYSYLWSNGVTTEDLLNVPAGNYQVTVTDANGCTGTNSFTVISPGNINVSITTTDPVCRGVNNGSISISVTGGIPPYTYLWSTGATTASITNLSEGTYSLTVSDAANCSVIQTVMLIAPNVMDLNVVITGINCPYDTIGAIKLIISGGTAPYNVVWNNGGQGLTITNLTAGSYTATVTDANGCITDSTFQLSSNSNLNVSIGSTSLSCDGTATGSAQAIVQGNTPPFVFEWSNGATTAGITGLLPGTYTVIVTDDLSCKDTATATIGIAVIAIDTTILSLPSCDTTRDGVIAIEMRGGNTGFAFVWSDGQDSSVAVNLMAGTYTVTITDANNCSLIDTTELKPQRICSDSLIIYDVFSPNSDGKNDLWIIDNLDLFPQNELQIFNRWGSLVYEAKPYLNDWDGRSKKGDPLPSATYYYILKLNGTRVYSGHVTIIR
jgi:gliding motility-associated-like protein